jgi:hypothetical protein
VTVTVTPDLAVDGIATDEAERAHSRPTAPVSEAVLLSDTGDRNCSLWSWRAGQEHRADATDGRRDYREVA